jgi:prepilin-type N-terminal cleavage/methylation domain-containing protein
MNSIRHNLSLFRRQNLGFSLVEMAIVLIIMGLLLAALFAPLQAQRNIAALTQTQTTLDNAKQALVGYAQSNGRLPCPATNASNGNEAPVGGGICTQPNGFLPAATLGIQPADAQGFALDGWDNRIRYAVNQTVMNPLDGTISASYHFTTSGEMANQGIVNLQPSLRVCASAALIVATRCSAVSPGVAESNFLANNAVAVIFSLGTTGEDTAGVDEAENLDTDHLFISHDITASTTNEFDHVVTWVSPYVLYNALVQAGQLH